MVEVVSSDNITRLRQAGIFFPCFKAFFFAPPLCGRYLDANIVQGTGVCGLLCFCSGCLIKRHNPTCVEIAGKSFPYRRLRSRFNSPVKCVFGRAACDLVSVFHWSLPGRNTETSSCWSKCATLARSDEKIVRHKHLKSLHPLVKC